jgi:hypothetical protein
MEHVMPMDQHDLPACYAFTAAQMVDAYRFSHGDTHYGHQTSGLAAALGTAVHNRQTSIAGGMICPVVDSIAEAGTCDQRSVLSMIGIYGNMKVLAQLYDRYRATGMPQTALRDWVVDQIISQLRAMGASGPMVPSRQSVALLLEQSSQTTFLNGLMSADCPNGHQYTPQIGQCKKLPDPWTYTHVMASIQSRLSQRAAQPIGIDYCAAVLKHGRGYLAEAHYGSADACYPHASLIIGRERDSAGRCRFLVRNVWGTDCKSNRHLEYSSHWTCEEGKGNVWVDAEDLVKNTIRAFYLE